jgi:hypothetical protein
MMDTTGQDRRNWYYLTEESVKLADERRLLRIIFNMTRWYPPARKLAKSYTASQKTMRNILQTALPRPSEYRLLKRSYTR